MADTETGHARRMIDMRSELGAAEPWRLLRYIASAIHGFTIMARDPDTSAEERSRINNSIHYLAGYMMALTKADERLTDSRIDAILELVGRLESPLAEAIRADLTR
ncbi:hypothetical protein ACFOMD_05450 [Sphingoaurantiacus capsulatus]|uniref:Uncharacterized protein n=1 Tax=Sphingoaurantiacus capsulatus TaxID=1771310 RepID=A0ABV7X786_9SPHN